jgi:hypothetical protein
LTGVTDQDTTKIETGRPDTTTWQCICNRMAGYQVTNQLKLGLCVESSLAWVHSTALRLGLAEGLLSFMFSTHVPVIGISVVHIQIYHLDGCDSVNFCFIPSAVSDIAL